MDGARRRLRLLADTLDATRASVEVWRGRPADTLADIARQYEADLIVVGPHRPRQGMWEGLGTTAERLLALAPVPVLLATGAPDLRPRHILIPVKESTVTPRVRAWGEMMARRFDAKATTLSVAEAGAASHVLTSIDRSLATLGGAGDECAESGAGRDQWITQMPSTGSGAPSTDNEIEFGDPGREILAAAARHESGMIVMGWPRAGRIRRALFGSVTSEVLRGAACPVLAVVEGDATG